MHSSAKFGSYMSKCSSVETVTESCPQIPIHSEKFKIHVQLTT